MRRANGSQDIGAGIEALPNFDLAGGATLSTAFFALDRGDYHAAARHVHRLPYGRNSSRANYGLVLTEGRGTCSTTHALLATLAREHGRSVVLRLGIYETYGDNTLGVGTLLRRYGLDLVPEARCYLACRGTRVDLTRTVATNAIEDFLCEETIEPAGSGRIDWTPTGSSYGVGCGAGAGLRACVAGQGRVHRGALGSCMRRKGTVR